MADPISGLGFQISPIFLLDSAVCADQESELLNRMGNFLAFTRIEPALLRAKLFSD